MKIDVKTKKFVISVILAFLSIGLCYVYGSAKAGAVFAILFLIVGSISLKKKIVEGSVLKALYLTMLFAIFSLITVFICQRVLNEGIISLGLWCFLQARFAEKCKTFL